MKKKNEILINAVKLKKGYVDYKTTTFSMGGGSSLPFCLS